jgi:hypothetical protein
MVVGDAAARCADRRRCDRHALHRHHAIALESGQPTMIIYDGGALELPAGMVDGDLRAVVPAHRGHPFELRHRPGVLRAGRSHHHRVAENRPDAETADGARARGFEIDQQLH